MQYYCTVSIVPGNEIFKHYAYRQILYSLCHLYVSLYLKNILFKPMILAILYRQVTYMLHAKYQSIRPSGSGEEVVKMVLTIYGHDGHLEFWIMTCFY